MSNIYNLEPPTKGKAMLITSNGEIEIELWAKEAPLAVRNFVQLCLEGYYNGTMFHRVVAGFIIQGGDPTGTGKGGSSIYGKVFKDEFHSRLKFTHRGLVGCANQNKPDTNGSQFFITLDRCEDLNRHYTIFGRVIGDTIFNVLRIGEVAVNDDSRPLDPIIISHTDVLWNPFEDIVPRLSEKELLVADNKKPPNKNPKTKKNLGLLSFGQEAEEDEAEILAASATKIRSVHDVLVDDNPLEDRPADTRGIGAQEDVNLSSQLTHVKEVLGLTQNPQRIDKLVGRIADGREDADKHTSESINSMAPLENRVVQGMRTATGNREQDAYVLSVDQEPGNDSKPLASSTEEFRDQTPASRLHLKRKVIQMEDIKDAELLTKSQIAKAKYKRRQQLRGEHEKSTLERLSQFTSSLKRAGQHTKRKDFNDITQVVPAVEQSLIDNCSMKNKDQHTEGKQQQVHSNVERSTDVPAPWRVDDYLRAEEPVGFDELRNHKLEFKEDPNKIDEMARRDDVNDYVVFDPLLEQGKAKFNKRQAQQKRKEREWSGRPFV